MDADDLKKRTKLFALRVLKLAAALPDSVEGKVIRGQLARCGTSVGANYRAACRGRSREEADESAFWMELIIEGSFLDEKRVVPLLDEAIQITKIMTRSRQSARRNMNTNRQSAIGNRK